MILYLVKYDLDGPQPIYVSNLMERRVVTDATTPPTAFPDFMAGLGGLVSIPPAGAKIESFGGAMIWRIAVGEMDVIAGPQTVNVNMDIGVLAKPIQAARDDVLAAVAELSAQLPHFPTEVRISVDQMNAIVFCETTQFPERLQ